jgi:acetylornithine deacetylase/succinyl-diaminopimelate desuccinylase-like protein
VKISLRIPPTCDPEGAVAAVKETLEAEPPHGAKVSFGNTGCAGGWNAPDLADWLAEAVDESSKTFFDHGAVLMGEGGTIPFMGLLGEKFPRAQFVITGVLGPASNAHGPNEFLHIPMGKKLTACVAQITARLCEWGKANAAD